MAAVEVVAPDLHLLAGEMVEGEFEFELGGLGVFAVGIALDDVAHLLERLERVRLVAADIGDLVVVAQTDQELRVGRVDVGREEVEIAPGGGAAFGVERPLMVGEGGHQHRALGPFGIGIEPLDLGEGLAGVARAAVGQQRLAAQEDLLRALILDRDLGFARERIGRQIGAAGQKADEEHRNERQTAIRRTRSFHSSLGHFRPRHTSATHTDGLS